MPDPKQNNHEEDHRKEYPSHAVSLRGIHEVVPAIRAENDGEDKEEIDGDFHRFDKFSSVLMPIDIRMADINCVWHVD